MEFTGKLRHVVQAGATVAAAGALLASFTPAASAAPIYYNVKNGNVATRCLDSDVKGKVYLLECEPGNENQAWSITGGKLTNKKTKLCLQSNGVAAETFVCSKVPIQQWTSTSGTKKWFEWNKSGDCLHALGGRLEPVSVRSCTIKPVASRWTTPPA